MIIGYVDDVEALAWITERYPIDFEEGDFTRGLYQAFDKIENINVRNPGTPNNFPRCGEDETPKRIEEAQMLEAYTIATNGGYDEAEDNISGVKSRSIGDMSISLNDSVRIGDVTFSNAKAGKIIRGFVRKTFGWGVGYASYRD